jgi:site-specific recombinase XerD
LEALSIRAKKRSVEVAASSLRRLTESFNGKDMTRLAINEVNAFIRSRQQDGVKPGTINGDLVALRAALNFAAEARLLEKVPVKVKLLRAPKKRVGDLFELLQYC